MKYLFALIISLNLLGAAALADTPVESHGAVPTGVASGIAVGVLAPDKFVTLNISTATTTLLVTNTNTAQSIRFNSFLLQTQAASSNNFTLEYGTGATCSGGLTALGQFYGASGTIATIQLALPAGQIIIPAGNNLCVVTAGGTPTLSGIFPYTVY